MASIPEELMQAAGFTGAQAAQSIGSAQAKAAINTNQLNLGGVQERRGITDAAETRGMLRSSMTNTQLGEQTAEQANKQQLIDLGLADTAAGAQIDVMQALAQQQAQQEQDAAQRAMFDAQMSLKRQQLDIEHPGNTINWDAISGLTGGRVAGPTSGNATGGNQWWNK